MVRENKAHRVTIMLDLDISKKLRNLQAKRIQNNPKSVSFSRVLNDTLRKTLK